MAFLDCLNTTFLLFPQTFQFLLLMLSAFRDTAHRDLLFLLGSLFLFYICKLLHYINGKIIS